MKLQAIHHHDRVVVYCALILTLLTVGASTCTRPADVGNQPADYTETKPAAMVVTAEWYVSPTGRPDNSGSIDNPIDLASALSGYRIKPGSVIWLRGGTYQGVFQSSLRGTQNAPIYVRQYPGERAVIDGSGSRGERENAVLAVFGEWTNYWGFEVTNSSPDRGYRSQAGRPQGVVVKAPHTKFINMIVHDTGNGFGFWREAVDSELYGNIVFNCGEKDPNSEGRGHGHAVYTQNDSGTKVIRDNLIFNQFGRGINAYPNPGGLAGFHIEGNISFNNGVWQGSESRYPNILIGGYAPFKSERMVLIKNYTYHSPSQSTKATKFTGANFCLGCSDPLENRDLTVKDNYVVGGVPVVYMGKWQQVSISGNTFYGDYGQVKLTTLDREISRTYNWNNNSYFGGSARSIEFMLGDVALDSFDDWRRETGVDQNSRYSNGPPDGVKIFITPNQYEPGRAYIAVYNWNRQDKVDVNLSGVLKTGQQFEIRNAQDLFGPPVTSGTYNDRPVALKMTGLYVAPPVGMRSTFSTSPEFNAFVVIPKSDLGSYQPSSAGLAQGEKRERKATRSAASLTESELQKFVGRYRALADGSEILVQLEYGRLRLFPKNDSPYTLTPVSATRFRIDGKPDGWFVEFAVRNNKVASMTATNGAGQSATAVRRN